ncbi:MAG: Ig-like domain-containing domain [Niabella sp.]
MAFAAIVAFLAETGCATIVPPSGGPRDSLPPVIVKVDPPSETTGFNSKKITFQFDEYVELDDVQKNMEVNPLPTQMPEVTRKLKTVTMRLRDSLEPNTTYTFNFKNVVKDLNEGNKAKDMIYVVSTGNYFDSMQLSGRVIIAKTNKADSTMTVMLHNDLEDSAVAKHRPRYIARVDTAGYFLFRHLSPGKYKLYALKDESGMYMYTNPEQVFAFADSVITIAPQPPKPVMLLAYNVEEKKEISVPVESSTKNKKKDKEKEKDRRLKFTTNLQGKLQDLLEPLVFKFENPLKVFDTTKIAFSADTSFTPITGNSFIIDSTRTSVTMNMRWQEGKDYNLILAKDFASDSTDRQLLKADTISFTTKTRADYGKAKITFLNFDASKNPVLLVLQGGTIKNAFPLKSNVLDIQIYAPGEYEMQLLIDDNKNGQWDPGEFFAEKKRQPERIYAIERKLIIKPDLLTEFELKL